MDPGLRSRAAGVGKQATVVVDGFYGGRNWGDEWILRGVLSGLKRARVQRIGQILVFSADPAKSREWHGVTAVKYLSVQAIWCLWRSRWLLIGGGGLFPGTLLSLLRRLTLVLLARLLGRRVSCVGVGLEPWRNALERTIAKLIFRLSHDVVVRDSVSVELLRRLGITMTKVRKASDFTFLALEGNRVRIPRGANDEPPTVTVALNGAMRRGESDAGRRALVDSLSTCASQGPLRVNFVVSSKEEGDELAAREIATSLPKSIKVDVVEPTTPDEWLSAVVQSSVVVTERMHPGIVASAYGIPVFFLCSRPKLSDWAREFHWGDNLSSLPRCLQESSMGTQSEAEEVVREHASSLERVIARIAAEIEG